jgi:hypothetical protein
VLAEKFFLTVFGFVVFFCSHFSGGFGGGEFYLSTVIFVEGVMLMDL